MLLSGKTGLRTRSAGGLAVRRENGTGPRGKNAVEKNITIRQVRMESDEVGMTPFSNISASVFKARSESPPTSRQSLGDVTNKLLAGRDTIVPNTKTFAPAKFIARNLRKRTVCKRSKRRICLSPIEERQEIDKDDLDKVIRDEEMVNSTCKSLSSVVRLQSKDPIIEYSPDIYNYLKLHEEKSCLGEEFLTSTDASCSKHPRSILVDWLIQVQSHRRLNDETLYLAVNLIDQFLNRSKIHLEKLQLLGITCLLLASKVEECFPPEIDTLCFLTDYTYTREDVIYMERIVLKTLHFDTFYPSCFHFYEHLSDTFTGTVEDLEKKVQIQNLAKYMTELSLCSSSVFYFLPSIRMAAALSLARKIVLGEDEETGTWTTPSVDIMGYGENELQACMQIYAMLLKKAPRARQQAARTKYSSVSRYGGISQFPILLESPAVKTLAECPNLSKSCNDSGACQN
ncbi:G2/mitotic-specific cyclin-B-like [Glandiceps talaboti]